MFCTDCGANNEENAWKCINCGKVLYRRQAPRRTVVVPDYLVPAILCTVFCCMPLGIPAIVFAAQAQTYKSNGKIKEAVEMSNKAKKFCMYSLFAQLIYISLFFIVWISLFAFSFIAGHK